MIATETREGLLGLVDVARSGSLIWTFIVQDYKLKYRRSAIGFLWSFLNPLLMVAVISAAFSFAFHRDGETSYTLHLLATLLPWFAFSQSIEEGSRSIIASEGMIRQFHLPKLIFPLRRIFFRILELVLFLVAFSAIAPLLGYRPNWSLLVLPLAVTNLLLFSCGLGSLGAVVVVYFRDAEHLISVFLRAWFYLSPIIVQFSSIPAEFQRYFALNPIYYILELFDAPLARGEWPAQEVMVIATAVSLTAFVIGLASFQWTEDDLIFRL